MRSIEFALIGDISYICSTSITVMGLGILTPPFIKVEWTNLNVEEKYGLLKQAFEGCKTAVPMPEDTEEFNKSIMKSLGVKSWSTFYKGGRHCSIGFDEKQAKYVLTPMIYLNESKSLYGIKNGIENISSTASPDDLVTTLEGLLTKIPKLAEEYYQRENETEDPLI